MLVLNTNKEENAGGMSNYNLVNGAYPDASQILIQPQGCNAREFRFSYPTESTQNLTSPVWNGNKCVVNPNQKLGILDINGTHINYLDTPMYTASSIAGGFASGNVGYNRCIYPNSFPQAFCSCSSYPRANGETRSTIRFGTAGTLEAGLEVGKRFRRQPRYFEYSGVCVDISKATYNNLEGGIEVAWGLISKNGVLKKIGATCICYKGIPTTSGAYYYNNYGSATFCNPAFLGEADADVIARGGHISEEGDRPYVDLTSYLKFDANYVADGVAAWVGTYGNYNCCSQFRIETGRRAAGNNDDESYARPFQISLD